MNLFGGKMVFGRERSDVKEGTEMDDLLLRITLETEEEFLSKEKGKCFEHLEENLSVFDEKAARLNFEQLLYVNKLRGIINGLSRSIDCTKGIPVYVADSIFLYDSYKFLMQDPPEAIHYVTGIKLGNVFTMDRMSCFKMDVRTAVYVKGNVLSSRDALMEMGQYGHLLHAWFHSHPGSGENATNPSPTDKNHQERLERGGYKAIGGIFTRDGYVRFFSLDRQFKLAIYGKGVEKINETVCRLSQL